MLAILAKKGLLPLKKGAETAASAGDTGTDGEGGEGSDADE